MKRALALVIVLSAGIVAGPASAVTKYCSPTGDYCTSTTRQSGAVFLRLTTFSFSGPLRICVTGPTSRRVCRIFRLRPRNGTWQVSVRWHRHYPNAGPGRYRVEFLTGPTRLGPVLDFRLR